MPGLLGKKIGMTSVFGADGKNIPCTVIEAGPCVVTQLKTVEKDGYQAVQVGFKQAAKRYPMPVDATEKYDVLAGRIRQDISRHDKKGIDMFVSGDQVLKGAALNAVQIAELL